MPFAHAQNQTGGGGNETVTNDCKVIKDDIKNFLDHINMYRVAKGQKKLENFNDFTRLIETLPLAIFFQELNKIEESNFNLDSIEKKCGGKENLNKIIEENQWITDPTTYYLFRKIMRASTSKLKECIHVNYEDLDTYKRYLELWIKKEDKLKIDKKIDDKEAPKSGPTDIHDLNNWQG